MTQPSGQEVSVATDSLRTEAAIWDLQANQIGNIALKAEGLRMSRLEAGLFQLIVSPYDALTTQVTARCREGQSALADIASTLRHVADTYDEEDRNSSHRLRNLY